MKIDSMVCIRKEAGKGIKWQREDNTKKLFSPSAERHDYFPIDSTSLQEFFDLSKHSTTNLNDLRQKYLHELNFRLQKLKELGGI